MMIGIARSWIITLPYAATLGAIAYSVLTRGI